MGLDDHCGRVAVRGPVKQLVKIRRTAHEPDGEDDPAIDAGPFIHGVVHEYVRDGMSEVVRGGIRVHQIGLHELDAVGQSHDGGVEIGLSASPFLLIHDWKISQVASRSYGGTDM